MLHVKDDMHPFVKIEWCKVNKLGKVNDLISSYMGEGKFTEKDHKYLRLNMFLCFELVNEILLYSTDLLMRDKNNEEARENIVLAVREQSENICEVSLRINSTNEERDKKHILLKITRELMKFFEIMTDIRSRFIFVFQEDVFKTELLAMNNNLLREIVELRKITGIELSIVINTLEHSFNDFLKNV